MSRQLATRIIDGDGHIMEDNAAIIAHMDRPYREIAQRKGVIFPPLDHLHAGRAVETPPPRAYNDWLSETYVKFNPRFKGMALIPMQDPAEAAKELRRAVAELGMLGAMMPSNGLPSPLGAKMYWPVYAEADRLGCCLAVHGGAHDRFGMDHMNMYVPVHALGHPWGLTINCADIVY